MPGPALKLFLWENDISGFDRPFTPIHGSSLRFQPKWGWAPRVLPRFTPCPWIAHPASRPRYVTQIALFRLAFAAARCPLTSPHAATRRLILQKARGHRRRNGSRCLGRTVSGAVTLLGVLFTFPRGTGSLSVIGECSALRVVLLLRTGFHVPGPTLIADRSPRPSRTGATRCGRPSHAVPLERGFLTAAGAWGPCSASPQH